MAKATKGVKVRALAEELGIDYHVILKKLKDEGLDWAHNHMSSLGFGQAETIREWFRSGELGSKNGEPAEADAAAPATAEEPASRLKPHRARKKKDGAEHDEHHDEAEGAHEEHPAPEAPAAPAVETPAAPAVVAETPALDSPVHPVALETTVAPEPVASIVAEPVAPEVPAAPVAPATEPPKVAAEAPVTAAPAKPAPPAAPAKKEFPQPPRKVERPTIKLGDRKNIPVVQPFVPKPATIQGPRVVREEKPDIVPTPRPRRPMQEQNSQGPAFTPARPQGGRGVKRAEDEDEEKKKANRASLSTRRRGADGRRGEADEKLREFTDADLIEREERLRQAAKSRQELDSHLKKTAQRGTHQLAKSAQQRGKVELELPITVRTLSSGLGIKAGELLFKLMQQRIPANINTSLDVETAQAIALEYGIELQIKREESLEEQLQREFEGREVDPAKLQIRPPVVTILGHVDHGKTSLLDRIRQANVAAGEAGGITQHIAAWMVTLGADADKAKRVTFIDTPGHQAFTAMRARGANMTDVVVLVVSAAEGVQPQTIESINHARAANVPIVVAMNKIDRPDSNPDMVLGQLAAQGLNPTQWGGETEVVPTSAINGQGIPELIEILDLQSQIMELKADPTAPASGRVIESAMHPGIGPAATVLIQSGTLKIGDVLLVGGVYGRVRSILNDRGQMIDTAGPSTPVIVAGLNGLASSGDKFYVLDDMERAKTIAEDRANRNRQEQLAGQNRATGSDLLSALRASNEVKTINLIIKADVQGSVETLVNSVTAQNTEEVQVKVIHSGVGAINESDVELAMATRINPDDASRPRKVAVIGFHVVPDESARNLAEQNRIDVKVYRVIYEIFDDLKKALSGMLEPEIREKLHGHAEIRRVFKYSKVGNIAGCMITDGHISRGSKIRLIRDGRVITEDLSIETLKRVKDDVKEVKSGFECGIKLAGYDDIKEGDRLEGYVREKFERTL